MIALSLVARWRVTAFHSHVLSPLLALICGAGLAAGQQAPAPAPSAPPSASRPGAPADRYEPVFEQLQKMAPQLDRVATVRMVTLRRDVIEFHFVDGTLCLATPVAGRVVGAVFVGRGSVTFTPPEPVEQSELKRVLGDSVLTARIVAVTFVFTDSTLAELEHHLSFGRAGVGDAADRLHDALDHLVDDRTQEVMQPTLMTALLNGETNAFFYAHVKREHGEDLMFLVDPHQAEQITLLRGGHPLRIVSQFRRSDDMDDTMPAARAARDPLTLQAYAIEATIAGNGGFAATATVRLAAQVDGVRWARFLLYPALAVDSLRTEAGPADTLFRAQQSSELWLRFATPLHAGDTRSLHVSYHGDVIGFRSILTELRRRMEERLRRQRLPVPAVNLPPGFDNWFFVKAPETWFPRYSPANPRYASWQPADMELTFHTPKRYQFATVGRLVDSRVDGDVQTTRWVTERPASEACFSIGEFDEFKITDPRIPPVTVQMNIELHRELDRFSFRRPGREEDVGGDVANSLAFFTQVYGPPLFGRFYATEIPFSYGQAFPGLMYLSMGTFLSLNASGREEEFRAHEMAHQWWGIGVEPDGYRDTWLSEGFAEFSGLWYMQSIMKDNEKFFTQLRTRREQLLARRHDVPPIALGWRVAQTDRPDEYSLIIYDKGAWVLHMLRNLMLNLRILQDDAFTATMQEFYREYRGKRASTRDFERVVDRHTVVPMRWFFRQWVEGTAIPTYILSWHAEPTQGGHYALHVRVRQEQVPEDFVMPVPLKIDYGGGLEVLVRMTVTGPASQATFDLPAEPKALQLNPLESVLAEVKTEGWH